MKKGRNKGINCLVVFSMLLPCVVFTSIAHAQDSSVTGIQSSMDISYLKRVEYQQQMLVFRSELKNKLGRDDWGKVFPADKKK